MAEITGGIASALRDNEGGRRMGSSMLLDLEPRAFLSAMDELGLPPDQRDYLLREYRRQSSPLARAYQGIQSIREGDLEEGRTRASLLPMTRPEGMTGYEALRSGEAEFAVPEFLLGGVESALNMLDMPGATLRGPVSEAEAVETAGELAGTLALPTLAARPEANVARMFGGRGTQSASTGFEFPDPKTSQRTQITGTFPTYERAVTILDDVAPRGRSLDYGAGRGMSTELGFDTFEPYPREDFKPTYSVPSAIPDESYERVTNFNVLNVVDPDSRGKIVRDIGRILKPDGVALITTRGRDVLTAKGISGPEEMSIVTSAGTYQKGFTRPELVDYLQSVLGKGFEVSPLRLGPAGAMVRKLSAGR